MKETRYTSKEGYTGVLYGKSSLIIYRPDGSESLHTGFRSINTYEELVELVDAHPEFIKALSKIKIEDLEDDNDEI